MYGWFSKRSPMRAVSGSFSVCERAAELSVGAVASRLKIAQSTASEQLAQLRDGGLLTSRRQGKTVYYRADPASVGAALADLQAYLGSCCPQ
jgi:DNA-binding transcriptional ArsR family regulator